MSITPRSIAFDGGEPRALLRGISGLGRWRLPRAGGSGSVAAVAVQARRCRRIRRARRGRDIEGGLADKHIFLIADANPDRKRRAVGQHVAGKFRQGVLGLGESPVQAWTFQPDIVADPFPTVEAIEIE